jgi:hypothetical protein
MYLSFSSSFICSATSFKLLLPRVVLGVPLPEEAAESLDFECGPLSPEPGTMRGETAMLERCS